VMHWAKTHRYCGEPKAGQDEVGPERSSDSRSSGGRDSWTVSMPAVRLGLLFVTLA
jgi:hypothetical protein